MDAPLHYLPDGQSADQLNVESLSGRCLLVEKEPNASELALMKHRKIEILLLKSGSVTLELLSRLQELRVKVIGNDLLSIASPEEERRIHVDLFRRGILPLECLNLDRVSPGLYHLLALPMLIEGAEAAPVRAFLTEVM